MKENRQYIPLHEALSSSMFHVIGTVEMLIWNRSDIALVFDCIEEMGEEAFLGFFDAEGGG